MKQKLLASLGFLCLLWFSHSVFSQTYVNAEWVDSLETSDTIPFVASCMDSDGYLIVVSNRQISSGNTDVSITKLDSEGDVIWETTFDGGANARDYGVAVRCDINNNVLVTGVVTINGNMADFALIKYDQNGNLVWSTTWDGGNSQNDIPSCMALDTKGNTVLAGGTFSSANRYDYAVIKIDSMGSLVWWASYDYANLEDFATAIELEDNDDENVIVTGASASAPNSWDYATIMFSHSDGSVLNDSRDSVPGLGLDKALAISRDEGGNYYITGYTEVNYVKDIQTVKLDSSFGFEWAQTYDGYGLDDVGTSLGIDAFANIYVAGFSKKANGGSDYVVIKYDSSGSAIWTKTFRAEDDSKLAVATKIRVLDSGDMYVTGYFELNGNLDSKTLFLNTDGDIKWEKNLDFFQGDDQPLDLVVDSNGDVYVIGTSDDGVNVSSVITKYSSLEKPGIDVLDTLGNPVYRSHQLLVRFQPGIVDDAFVDNKEVQFGDMAEVIPDSIMDSIDVKLGGKFSVANPKVMKVVQRLTTDDTLSITRLGDSIPMPDFWSVLLMELPEGFDVEEAADSLSSLSKYVQYAEPNYVSWIHAIPNDTLFRSEQESLFPTQAFPSGHINIETAWDTEVGRNWVKVGVFDFTIWWPHEDFGGPDFVNSKIEGGWDYVGNSSIQNAITPKSSHGTSVAGIIGALRNNGQIGIAGIAGGDVDNFGNSGVELFSMGIGKGNSGRIDNDAAFSAIIEGAAFTTTGFGYGLHIQNHSWGGPNSNEAIRSAVKFSFRNHCLFVASRGNEGDTDPVYPSSYHDDLTVSVGASGTDGEAHDGQHGENEFHTSYGGTMDLIAPGVRDLVATPYYPDEPWNWSSCTVSASNYDCFNGSSAAAPHVTGVAALMMSHHNVNRGLANNLAPDDVEFLLQRYATDIVNLPKGYAAGYDQYNAWGRVNADATLDMLVNPIYRVFHSGTPATRTLTSAQSSQLITVMESIDGLAAGAYVAQRFDITETYTDVFSANTQVIDNWKRNSSVRGYGSTNASFYDVSDQNITFTVTGNTVNVTSTVTCWHVTQTMLGQPVDVWLPRHHSDLRTAYSLHLFDNPATDNSEIADEGKLSVSPIPTTDDITVRYDLANTKIGQLQILDLNGRVLLSEDIPGGMSQEVQVSLTGFASGVYVCKVFTDKAQYFRKLVKQ